MNPKMTVRLFRLHNSFDKTKWNSTNVWTNSGDENTEREIEQNIENIVWKKTKWKQRSGTAIKDAKKETKNVVEK